MKKTIKKLIAERTGQTVSDIDYAMGFMFPAEINILKGCLPECADMIMDTRESDHEKSDFEKLVEKLLNHI